MATILPSFPLRNTLRLHHNGEGGQDVFNTLPDKRGPSDRQTAEDK